MSKFTKRHSNLVKSRCLFPFIFTCQCSWRVCMKDRSYKPLYIVVGSTSPRVNRWQWFLCFHEGRVRCCISWTARFCKLWFCRYTACKSGNHWQSMENRSEEHVRAALKCIMAVRLIQRAIDYKLAFYHLNAGQRLKRTLIRMIIQAIIAPCKRPLILYPQVRLWRIWDKHTIGTLPLYAGHRGPSRNL